MPPITTALPANTVTVAANRNPITVASARTRTAS